MSIFKTTLLGDIPQGGWVELVPAFFRPYLRLMRLDRPIGTWLLLFPCWWSIALASPGLPDFKLMLLFGIGALVMRGAGCTINDIADREFDAKVERTRGRPLASGALNLYQAFLFLGLQLLIGLLILLQLNDFAVFLGAASLLLVVPYPFMKRITYWPQAWLGLTFNWGALLGFAAVTGELSLAPLLLYIGGIFWTLSYDTIYAHQDKEDDVFVGVKSTALRLGDNTPKWLLCFDLLFLGLSGWAGYLSGLGWGFYCGLVGVAAHLLWQASRVDLNSSGDCLAKFKSNKWLGVIMLAGIVMGKFF